MKKMLVAAAVFASLPLAGAFAAPLSAQDQMFVKQAAIGGMTEVRAGKLASRDAQAPEVRQFADKMVSDHTANDQALIALAKQKGVALPAGLDPQHQQMVATLRKTPKARFDQAYIQGQVAGHQKMEGVMQAEIQSGTDPDLKAFAQQTLPVVQDHLAMAQQMQSKS
jgi:putative membrane protein